MRLALALLLTAPLLAQTPRYREELTVTEVSIDINVTDRDGNPVTGLTADDFEVLEDGKPVAITWFREFVASDGRSAAAEGRDLPAETAPATSEPRTAFIFLENGAIERSTRARMFDALASAVPEMMNGGVEVVYFLWTDQLLMLRPDDVETAVDILEKWKTDGALVRASVARNRSRAGTLRFDDTDLGLAQANARTANSNLYAAVEAATKVAATARGRRIMILASRGFSVPTPHPMDILAADAARDVLDDHPLWTDKPGGPLFAPELMIPTHGESSERVSYGDAAAALSNRHGITIYGLFSGGLEAAAVRSGTESRLLAAGAPEPFTVDAGARQLPREVGSIADVAYRTGGLWYGAGSDYAPFLESVARDLNHYYTIAYRSTPQLRFRRLEVRTTNPEWSVRHREATVPDDEPLRR